MSLNFYYTNFEKGAKTGKSKRRVLKASDVILFENDTVQIKLLLILIALPVTFDFLLTVLHFWQIASHRNISFAMDAVTLFSSFHLNRIL